MRLVQQPLAVPHQHEYQRHINSASYIAIDFHSFSCLWWVPLFSWKQQDCYRLRERGVLEKRILEVQDIAEAHRRFALAAPHVVFNDDDNMSGAVTMCSPRANVSDAEPLRWPYGVPTTGQRHRKVRLCRAFYALTNCVAKKVNCSTIRRVVRAECGDLVDETMRQKVKSEYAKDGRNSMMMMM